MNFQVGPPPLEQLKPPPPGIDKKISRHGPLTMQALRIYNFEVTPHLETHPARAKVTLSGTMTARWEW